MCACGDVRKTRAWEHPIQAAALGQDMGVEGGAGRVLALQLEAGAAPSFLVQVRLLPLKPVPSLMHGKHKRSTCMQKRYKNN